MYSFQGETPATVKLIIESQQKNPSLSKEFISYLWKSINGKGSSDIKSAGVVYRDRDNASIVAQNLTKYKVDIVLLSAETGDELGDVVKIGQRAIFKITNFADIPLFINVIDVDSAGNMAPCIPITDQSFLPQLMVPANSEVVLNSFPIEFSHPEGIDTLIPIAWPDPYSVESVANHIKNVQGHIIRVER